ncbi:flagellar motor switch protein FliM [Limnohabitans sp. Rim8]|jgi:flagellar motor switch protein FliM|uniref:Flagellar motor switch protein FliM n=1 Tax=Limnohabitans curvus TaxID=323423 RepID=A0A315EUU1_9BURK|nr:MULTISPECIES: flagellar motor switch protein FliM [Limnohabitans]PUE56630.1 flagellar motor switch protein FliM [Limnohabitans sp. Rim8]PUE59794.1 flagellar motor switch protein FliM [Limnohabitans curvus]BDU52192.1 flagellar motor switch protein FliM [Limnohabitans sp. INBF002]
MKSNLLSDEELAALSEGVRDGSIETDTGFNSSVRVRKHDLASEDSSLGVNVSSIDMINERFIRLFRLGLLEVLRTSPRVNPTRVQILKFGDYLKGLRAPLSVNMVRMNPLRGNSVIIIDPNVVFSSLDSFFGGFGKGVGELPPSRLFTPTETRIIKIILEVFFRSLTEAWGPLMPIECEHVSSEINPQFAQIADENDLVVLSRFEADATASGGKGFIDLVYPYATLKPVRELLSSRVQSGEGNEESDKKWRKDLAAAVGDAKLELQVTMGEIKTTLHHLNHLQEGDLLFFKKDDTALMSTDGVPAFHVNVGTRGSQVAVQIDHEHVHGKL